MLFMVIENFRNGNAKSIYHRAREQGRLMPEGVETIESWVCADLNRCFQLISSNEVQLIQDWVNNWSDLIEFEIFPVSTSKEAAALFVKL